MEKIRETQLDAWDDLQDTIASKRGVVLNTIRSRGGACLWEISQHLHWPINRVSGRVTELSRMGLISDKGKRKLNPNSGKKTIFWEVQ